MLVEFEDGVDSEVARESAESDGNIGFEEEVDGQPDCEILRVERASRRDPEHKPDEVQVPLGLMCKNKLGSYPASTTV
jgi:hypothetical protein